VLRGFGRQVTRGRARRIVAQGLIRAAEALLRSAGRWQREGYLGLALVEWTVWFSGRLRRVAARLAGVRCSRPAARRRIMQRAAILVSRSAFSRGPSLGGIDEMPRLSHRVDITAAPLNGCIPHRSGPHRS
jgi:hypothetical protein